jgi:signal transduction histidine kinase
MLQVLLNLVRNAVQSSQDGATVTVRGQRQASAALLEVVDTGEGLPAALGEDIFKPFVTTRTDGTGLGLAVSRQIVEAHGGTLTARPGADRGTIFALRLPLRPPRASPGAP